MIVIAKFNESNNRIPDKFKIIKITKVINEYSKKIFNDCFSVSALLKEIKLVKDFLKL